MKFLTVFIALFLSSIHLSSQDSEKEPSAFIGINGMLGWHSVIFKGFDSSPGASFGLSLSLGIYAVNKGIYKGGLLFNLLEGASRDTSRRRLSEAFILPKPTYDKHILFNFAQFRAADIGWFHELQAAEKLAIYHQIGFGIFGTTEKDQLFDFSMSNQVGILFGKPDRFRLRLGISYDNTFGTGNPNYLQNNWGFIFGGTRGF